MAILLSKDAPKWALAKLHAVLGGLYTWVVQNGRYD